MTMCSAMQKRNKITASFLALQSKWTPNRAWNMHPARREISGETQVWPSGDPFFVAQGDSRTWRREQFECVFRYLLERTTWFVSEFHLLGEFPWLLQPRSEWYFLREMSCVVWNLGKCETASRIKSWTVTVPGFLALA